MSWKYQVLFAWSFWSNGLIGSFTVLFCLGPVILIGDLFFVEILPLPYYLAFFAKLGTKLRVQSDYKLVFHPKKGAFYRKNTKILVFIRFSLAQITEPYHKLLEVSTKVLGKGRWAGYQCSCLLYSTGHVPVLFPKL